MYLNDAHLGEGVAELLRHDAVEDEVDGGVDEHQDVHHVADVDVHLPPRRAEVVIKTVFKTCLPYPPLNMQQFGS